MEIKHQLHPSKLADTIDSSFFGVDAHLVKLINENIDEETFMALKTLLEKVNPNKVKDAYDKGYEMGYDDGFHVAQAEASQHYQNGDE